MAFHLKIFTNSPVCNGEGNYTNCSGDLGAIIIDSHLYCPTVDINGSHSIHSEFLM